jgi:hypothetical protein
MRPVTVHEVVVVEVHVRPPGVAVTVKPVTALPPLLSGAIQETSEAAFAFEDAVTAVGAPGTAAGIAAADAIDAAEVSARFDAVTLNV